MRGSTAQLSRDTTPRFPPVWTARYVAGFFTFCSLLTGHQKLEVVDKGSLHGTYVNGGNRIPTNERRELKDGDSLTFGAPIWRATQEFHPVTVKVGFRFTDP